MSLDPEIEERWRKSLTEGEKVQHYMRHLFGLLPANPRCKICNAPFKGTGGALMLLIGKHPSRYNPNFCDQCEQFAEPGGAQLVISMLFADVRGSTSLAERIPPHEFVRLMNRFYKAATDVLIRADAAVDKFVGDEVIGYFVPGMSGPDHARRAVESAQRILRATGHGDPGGPWLPVGIGVHTGEAFVGVVAGADGAAKDFTALGDNVNIAARLASSAAAGEVLVSQAACLAAAVDPAGLEHRDLALKGKSESFGVNVMKISAG